MELQLMRAIKGLHTSGCLGFVYHVMIDSNTDICVELDNYTQTLTIVYEGKDARVLKAVQANREELMSFFGAKTVLFPIAYKSKVDEMPLGWSKTLVCLFYGLVRCNFIIRYKNALLEDDYLTREIHFDTVENPTFVVVAERLREGIICEEEDDEEFRLKKFKHVFRNGFEINRFKSKMDMFLENRTEHSFELEDRVFSREYKTRHNSLFFHARVN